MRKVILLIGVLSAVHATPLGAQTQAPPNPFSDGLSEHSFWMDPGYFSPPVWAALAAGELNPPTINLADLFPPTRTALLPESRTDAQLQAILGAYAGHWRGTYTLRLTDGSVVTRMPIDVIYSVEKETVPGATADKDKPRTILQRATRYIKNGETVTEIVRIRVDNGDIIATSSHNNIVEWYRARTRGSSLIWFSMDPKKSATDYGMTETLRPTADGGTLTMRGFETISENGKPVLVSETAELKLVK